MSANRNAATGLYKPPGMVKWTRYRCIVKLVDCFQVMSVHCSTPSPLTTLDVLGRCLSPTTFSTILFAGEVGTVQVLKRAWDLAKTQRGMQGQEKVEISGQQLPGRKPPSPSARNSIRALLLEDVEWLHHTSMKNYVYCLRGRSL